MDGWSAGRVPCWLVEMPTAAAVVEQTNGMRSWLVPSCTRTRTLLAETFPLPKPLEGSAERKCPARPSRSAVVCACLGCPGVADGGLARLTVRRGVLAACKEITQLSPRGTKRGRRRSRSDGRRDPKLPWWPAQSATAAFRSKRRKRPRRRRRASSWSTTSRPPSPEINHLRLPNARGPGSRRHAPRARINGSAAMKTSALGVAASALLVLSLAVVAPWSASAVVVSPGSGVADLTSQICASAVSQQRSGTQIGPARSAVRRSEWVRADGGRGRLARDRQGAPVQPGPLAQRSL